MYSLKLFQQGRDLQDLHEVDEDDWDRHLNDGRQSDDNLDEHKHRLPESPQSSTCPFPEFSDDAFPQNDDEDERCHNQANGEAHRWA